MLEVWVCVGVVAAAVPVAGRPGDVSIADAAPRAFGDGGSVGDDGGSPVGVVMEAVLLVMLPSSAG